MTAHNESSGRKAENYSITIIDYSLTMGLDHGAACSRESSGLWTFLYSYA